MDGAYKKKCIYCGKPYSYKNPKFPVPDCDCSHEYYVCKNARFFRIKRIKQLREDYNKFGFTTKKRLKQYAGTYSASAKDFINNVDKNKSQGLLSIGTNEQDMNLFVEVIAKEILLKRYSLCRLSLSEYLNQLQQTYSYGSKLTFDDLLNNLLKKDLIVINDFCFGEYTGKKLENTFILFKQIINSKKSFIITARPEDISRLKDISEMQPIFDLLREHTQVLTFKKP